MDSVITLISETISGYDANGNEQITRSEREIFCRVDDVSRNEFYSGATAGLKPEITATIFHAEYEGEKKAIHDGKEYNIIRTYRGSGVGLDEVELVLERTIRNGL
ncbi:MAG: hypothetical protein II630_00530 [Bacteroidales bacterium]|nr:hypothetical protein [Bacteroidales bacterium]